MTTWRSCSWCSTMNPTTERFCSDCGHEAQVSRMECLCPKCEKQRRDYYSAEFVRKEETEN